MSETTLPPLEHVRSTGANIGVRVMLMGVPGSGKTYSTRTLGGLSKLKGIFYLGLEPGFSHIRAWAQEEPRVHYAYVSPGAASWREITGMAQNINTLSMELLQKTSGNKEQYRQFFDLLVLMQNFVDQNGEEFGDVLTWGPDRVLILDSLTGLNQLANALTVGSKVLRTQPEWGVMQGAVKTIVDTLTLSTRCHFILTTHLEMHQDEISGGIFKTPAVLGKAPAKDIGNYFDDMIIATREGSKFLWDTADSQAMTKARHLPIAGKQEPSFFPLFEKWEELGGLYLPRNPENGENAT